MFVGCQICLSSDHPTESCMTFQGDDEQANFIGGSSSQQWTPGWFHGSHPFQNQSPQNPFQYQYQDRQRQHPQVAIPQQEESNSKPSLEDLVRSIVQSQQSFQDETRKSLKNLEEQMIQFSSVANKLEYRKEILIETEKIPSNASAITLASGKKYEGPELPKEEKVTNEDEKEVEVPSPDEASSRTNKDKLILTSKVTPPPFLGFSSVNFIDVIDPFHFESFELENRDAFEFVLSRFLDGKKLTKVAKEMDFGQKVMDVVATQLRPSQCMRRIFLDHG